MKLFGWLVDVESCFLHGNGNGFDIHKRGGEVAGISHDLHI